MKKHRQPRGQTLVLALVLMVILAVAALFLFDFQSVIRSKLKVESASQAAAVSAAQWQRESLNLIGELNLVKASTALLAEIPPKVSAGLGANMNDTELLQVAASDQLLTEMQTRVSFVGPLIAWGAAEQAVKNNGINGQSGVMARALDRYIGKIADNDDMRYYEPVNGYYWRGPYMALLQTLRDSTHLAVRPNGIFAGIDHVDPSWLGDEGLYRAIRTRNWCYPTLNRLIKEYPDAFWESHWFQVDLSPAHFPEESEVFTLDIEFGRRKLRGQARRSLRDELKRYQLQPNNLPDGFVRWALYGDSWLADAGGAYTGPDLTIWQGPGGKGGGPYFYLRRDLRDSAIYGGPVAAIELAQDVPTLSRWQGARNPDDEPEPQESYNAGLVREVKSPEVEVGNYSVARPIGALRNTADLPPVAAQAVLPVFTDAVLIPGSMLRYRMMPAGGNKLEAFLLWLAWIDDLYNFAVPPPPGVEAYLEALRTLANPAWRRIGWNPDWQWSSGNEAMAAEILSGQSSRQPGWLQAPVIYRQYDDGRYPDGRLTVVRQQDGTVEYHWGNRYFVQNADGSIETNEATKCFQAPGGAGGTYGINTGPPHR